MGAGTASGALIVSGAPRGQGQAQQGSAVSVGAGRGPVRGARVAFLWVCGPGVPRVRLRSGSCTCSLGSAGRPRSGSPAPPARPSPMASSCGRPPHPVLGPLARRPRPLRPRPAISPRPRPAALPFSCGSGVSGQRRRHKLPRWRRAGGCEQRSGRAGRGAEPGRRQEDGAGAGGAGWAPRTRSRG